MDMFLDFFNQIIDFINQIPVKSDSYWERIVLWLIVTYLEIKIYMMEFAASMAATILNSVGISAAITNSWSYVPNQFQSVFLYLKIPDAINMIISAYLTRFILGMLP